MPGQQLHDYSEEELLYNRFMEPALLQAMSLLSFPKTNATVLDAGCGPGGLFALLLEALGPSGVLVAIDCSTPHLEVAKKLITSHRLRNAFASFKWIWNRPCPTRTVPSMTCGPPM
jgi:predicted RNA methylase